MIIQISFISPLFIYATVKRASMARLTSTHCFCFSFYSFYINSAYSQDTCWNCCNLSFKFTLKHSWYVFLFIYYASTFLQFGCVCISAVQQNRLLIVSDILLFTHEFARAWTKSNTQNVITSNEGEKRKIFFLNLTTNKTRSTASNDWLKRDDDVKLHRRSLKILCHYKKSMQKNV